MLETVQLNEILYRLLFDRAFSEAFAAGKWRELDIPADLHNDLASVDVSELLKMNTQIRREVGSGAGGELLKTFPKTFELLESNGLPTDAVLSNFIASKEYDLYRELPFAGSGICIEEAFHFYVVENGSADAKFEIANNWSKHEFLMSLIPQLPVNRNPCFEILAPEVKYNGSCFYAAVHYPADFRMAVAKRGATDMEDAAAPFLYSASPTHFVCGVVTPAMINLLEAREVDAHAPPNTPRVGLEAMTKRLQGWGML